MKNKIKKYISSLIIIAASGLVSSCFSDKSSLDTNKIEDIVIETPEMPSILRVDYLGNVDFEPTIKVGSEINPSFVTYKWEINQTPGSTDMVVLSTDRVLKTTIKNQILSVAYTLVFTARDERYGIEYQKSWPLYVSSSFREGIVVAESSDGTTSDISLIMDNNITTSYSSGSNIKYKIWETATGNSYPSLIKSIVYTLHKPTSLLTKNIIVTISQDKEINMFDCENYSQYKTSAQIFPAKTSSFDPQAFYSINNQYWVLVANNVAYVYPSNQGVTSFMLPVSGTNYVDNAVMVCDNSAGAGPYAFWYNNNTGKIYNITAPYSSPAGGGEYSAQGVFNPTNLPGRRIIAGDISVDGISPTMLMRNESTGNYEIYSMSFGYYDSNWNYFPSNPKLKAELPSGLTSIINSSVSVFFNMFEPVMFVATQSKIYAVTFGGGIVSYSEVYNVPSGEQITLAKLYVQGRYRLNRTEFSQESGPIFEPPLALNTKAIVVATKKSEYEGQIYLIPQSASSTGALNISQAKKYSGFGKILDFTMQGQ